MVGPDAEAVSTAGLLGTLRREHTREFASGQGGLAEMSVAVSALGPEGRERQGATDGEGSLREVLIWE